MDLTQYTITHSPVIHAYLVISYLQYTKSCKYSTFLLYAHRTCQMVQWPSLKMRTSLDCFLLFTVFPQKHGWQLLTYCWQAHLPACNIRPATVWHLLLKCFHICRNPSIKFCLSVLLHLLMLKHSIWRVDNLNGLPIKQPFKLESLFLHLSAVADTC